MQLNSIDADIFEYEDKYKYLSHIRSFEIDDEHKIIDFVWFDSKEWGYIIVNLADIEE